MDEEVVIERSEHGYVARRGIVNEAMSVDGMSWYQVGARFGFSSYDYRQAFYRKYLRGAAPTAAMTVRLKEGQGGSLVADHPTVGRMEIKPDPAALSDTVVEPEPEKLYHGPDWEKWGDGLYESVKDPDCRALIHDGLGLFRSARSGWTGPIGTLSHNYRRIGDADLSAAFEVSS